MRIVRTTLLAIACGAAASTANAALVVYEDFESVPLGTPPVQLASGFLTAGGPGGGGSPVAPTISIVSPGLSGSNQGYQAVHGTGNFNYNGDIPFDTLINLDPANPIVEVTARYVREDPGTGTYNTLRLIGNTNVSSLGSYSQIGSDLSLGSSGATVTGSWDLTAYIASLTLTPVGPYNNLRFVLNKNGNGTGTLVIDNIRYQAIPEPSALALFALSGCLLTRRRRQLSTM